MTQMGSAMWETQLLSLGWEALLEKEMGTHSSILAWRIPWTEDPGRHSLRGHKELDTTERLTHTAGNYSSFRTIFYNNCVSA